MTLLIISPDYASHLLPLVTLGAAWQDAGHRVVVACGPATASIVESFGFERVDLRLGKGSNPGVIRAENQPPGEDDALRSFFDATRRGMIATLEFQAQLRLSDLMWEPVRIAREVSAVVEAIAPDHVLVDHLAFSARLALTATGTRYADVVLGHPSALPVGDEIYGFPTELPKAFRASRAELESLRALCARVSESFTAEWNEALAKVNPLVPPTANAFAEHGDILMLNYPQELADPNRLLPPHVFLGSAVRSEPVDDEVESWLDSNTEPFVYVSFGSFLSVRSDVTAVVVDSLKQLGLRAAIAIGLADQADLGPLPPSWLVREYLPQVRLLEHAAVAVTHGGNNSITEAMTWGVPLVVLPFSTDQFAGAAAIERGGFGVVLAPNEASAADIADAIGHVLALPRDRFESLSASLRYTPGSSRALSALSATSSNIAAGSDDASR